MKAEIAGPSTSGDLPTPEAPPAAQIPERSEGGEAPPPAESAPADAQPAEGGQG